jgi:predicted metal-binding membrane protein
MIVVGSLLAITILALGYTWWLGNGFDMSAMMSPDFIPWSAAHFTFMFVMWVVMMIGMMTPSIAPMVLLYVAVGRSSVGAGQAFAPAGAFVAGYLLSWTAFSAAATLLQWLLESRALITPMMAGTSRPLAGLVLIAAGIYQWLPLKQSCLSQCRAPLSFVQRHGVRLIDDLCCPLETNRSDEAEVEERLYAGVLRSRGYAVWQN